MDELRHVEHLVFDVKEKAAELRTTEAAHGSLNRHAEDSADGKCQVMAELLHLEHLVFDVTEKVAELRTMEAAHDSLIRLRTTPTMSVGVDAPRPCVSTGVTSALPRPPKNP